MTPSSFVSIYFDKVIQDESNPLLPLDAAVLSKRAFFLGKIWKKNTFSHILEFRMVVGDLLDVLECTYQRAPPFRILLEHVGRYIGGWPPTSMYVFPRGRL